MDIDDEIRSALAASPAPAASDAALDDEIRTTLRSAGHLPSAGIQEREAAQSRGLDDEIRSSLQDAGAPPGPQDTLGLSPLDKLDGPALYNRFGLHLPSKPAHGEQTYIADKVAAFKNGEDLPVFAKNFVDNSNLLGFSGAGREEVEATQAKLLQAYSLGAKIERTPASPTEHNASFHRLTADYLSRLPVPTPNGPQPIGALLPQNITPAEVTDLVVRYCGTGRSDAGFKPAELAAWNAINGPQLTQFITDNANDAVKHARLEALTGQPSGRSAEPLSLQARTEPESSGVAKVMGHVPFSFRPSSLAPIDPTISQWVGIEQAAQSGSEEAARYAANTSQRAFNLTGPFQLIQSTALGLGRALGPPGLLANSPLSAPIPNLDVGPQASGAALTRAVENTTSVATTALAVPAAVLGPIIETATKLLDSSFSALSQVTGGPDAVQAAYGKLLSFMGRGLDPTLNTDPTTSAFGQRILDNLPADGDPTSSLIGRSAYDAHKLTSAFMSDMQWDEFNPYATAAVADMAKEMGRSPGALIANIVGVGLAGGAALGAAKTIGLVTKAGTAGQSFITGGQLVPRAGAAGHIPLWGQVRALKYDTTTNTGAARGAARGALIQRLNYEVGKVSTGADAAAVTARMLDTLQFEKRGLSPEDLGPVITDLQAIRSKSLALRSDAISPALREGLLQHTSTLADIGPTEAYWAATGKTIRFGPAERLRQFGKTIDTLEQISDGRLDRAPDYATAGIPRSTLASAADAVSTLHSNMANAAQRHSNLTHLTDDALSHIENTQQVRGAQYTDLVTRQLQTIHSTKTELLDAAERADTLIERGGSVFHEEAIPLAERVEPPKPAEAIAKEADIQARLKAATDPDARFDLMQEWETYRKEQKLGEMRPAATTRIIETKILPTHDPARLKLANSIKDKIALAPEQEIPRFTEKELAFLNENRQVPLNPEASRASVRALADDRKTLKARMELGFTQQKRIAAFRDHLDTVDLTSPEGARVKLPKDVIRDLHEVHGNAAPATDKGYFTYHGGIPLGLKTASELLDHTIRTLRQEKLEKSFESALHKVSSLDLQALLSTGTHAAKRDFRHTINRLRDEANGMGALLMSRATAFSRELGLLDPAAGLKFMDDLAEGRSTGHPLLEAKLRTFRDSMLRDLVGAGVLDQATYEAYMKNPDWYHGFFDQHGSQFRRDEYPLPARFQRLTAEQGWRNAKIPEDNKFYAVWQDPATGRSRMQSGFATPEAANAWLESSDFPRSTHVDIRQGLDRAQKMVRGLVLDPAVSNQTFAADVSKSIARARLARVFANTPMVKTALEAIPLETSFSPELGYAVDAHGVKWYKTSNPDVTHLTGKFVHQDVMDYMRANRMGSETFEQMAEAYSTHAGLKNRALFQGRGPTASVNPLLGYFGSLLDSALPATKDAAPSLLARGLSATATAIGLNKCALSLASHATQWTANLMVYSRAAGVETLDPFNWPTLVRYMRDFMRGESPAHDTLCKAGYDNPNASFFRSKSPTEFLKRQLDDWHKDAATLEARIDYLRDAASTETIPARADALHAGILELENTLQTQASKGWATLFGHSLTDYGHAAVSYLKGAEHAAWHSFGLPDRLTKDFTFRHLVEKQGLSPEAALDRIGLFTQNLDKVPASVASLRKEALGSQFITYPYNALQIYRNIATHRPGWLAANGAMLAGWNYANLALSGQDPDELADAWSFQNWGTTGVGPRLSFLLDRLVTPGGNHSISLASTGIDVFTPTSPAARAGSGWIRDSELPFYGKALTAAGIGVASKFLGGQAMTSIYSHLATQHDTMGRPYRNPADSLVDAAKNTLVPQTALDLGLFNSSGIIPTAVRGGLYDVRDFSKKTAGDLVLQKLFKVLPPNEITPDQIVFSALADVQRSMRGSASGEWEKFSNFQNLRKRITLEALDNGVLNRDKLRATGASYRAETNGPLSTTDPTKITAQMMRACTPAAADRFAHSSLAEQLLTLAKVAPLIPSRPEALNKYAAIVQSRLGDHALISNDQVDQALRASIQIQNDPLQTPNTKRFVAWAASRATHLYAKVQSNKP